MANALKAVTRGFSTLLAGILIVCVRIYQYTISPLLGPRCRFWPSCSSYAIEAIQVHGPAKGGWMAVKRLLKCHPGHSGGMDPVPGGRSELLCAEDAERRRDASEEKCQHHSCH